MFSQVDRRFCAAVSGVIFVNPFDTEAIERNVRSAAGLSSRLKTHNHSPLADDLQVADRPELTPVLRRAVALIESLKDDVRKQPQDLTPEDFQLYQDLAHFVLYFTFRDRFQANIARGLVANRR